MEKSNVSANAGSFVNVHDNVLSAIGNTPIVRLNKCVPAGKHQFFGKVEFFNPGGSVKDRIAMAIIEDAEKRGELKPGGTIVEATSGNTGVGLGLVGLLKGYKCVFVMPEKISEEKRAVLRAYGAKVVMTPTGLEPEDPNSHYSVAKRIVAETPGAYLANQYNNPANVLVHYQKTGPEIWKQMAGQIDVFVGGIGTGGTLSGVGRYLKEQNKNIKVVCSDPIGSILYDLFYFKEVRDPAKSYLVEGIGEDMLPDNVHFQYMDDFVRVTDAESFKACRDLAAKEGLLVGPSCGAALAAAIKYSEKLEKPSKILVIFPDGGRSYLSKAFNEGWLQEKGLN
jgi:cystathionine beta-synthase